MKKIENFYLALENLKDIFNYNEPYSNVVLTGLVGLYEICFEISWKAIKEILIEQGYNEATTGSPRQILKLAYECGIINDEKLWLSAMVDRNNVVHSYNKNVAIDIINKIKNQYYYMFCDLKEKIQSIH